MGASLTWPMVLYQVGLTLKQHPELRDIAALRGVSDEGALRFAVAWQLYGEGLYALPRLSTLDNWR